MRAGRAGRAARRRRAQRELAGHARAAAGRALALALRARAARRRAACRDNPSVNIESQIASVSEAVDRSVCLMEAGD